MQRIAIKNKSEFKYINSDEIEIGNITLKQLANKVNKQQDIIVSLLEEIKEHHLVKKDTAYLVKIGNQVKQVDKLELVAVEDLKYPLSYYDIIEGKITLNKKKVVAV